MLLGNLPRKQRDPILQEVLENLDDMVQDKYGSYLVEKVFEMGTREERQTLAQRFKGRVYQLSLDRYGSRVIEKALEVLTPEQRKELFNELANPEDNLLNCFQDENAFHVIRTYIRCSRSDKTALDPIIQAIKGRVFELAVHPQATMIVQDMIKHSGREQRDSILPLIMQRIHELILNPFGNYVIQSLLEKCPNQVAAQIIDSLRGNILKLSHHKYASLVIEKLLQVSSREERQIIIREILSFSDKESFDMDRDAFANYVLKAVMKYANPDQKSSLINKIHRHAYLLRNSSQKDS